MGSNHATAAFVSKERRLTSGKRFWKAYGSKWEAFTAEQRNKTDWVWTTNISVETRNKLLADFWNEVAIKTQPN